MKMLLVASALIYSSLSFADYNCHDKDSNLQISQLPKNKVFAELKTKEGQKKFSGQTVKNDNSTVYYALTTYVLKDSDGNKAILKISTTPIMSRVPCHGRRICNEDFTPYEVSAELDYQGKVSIYECSEI